MPETTSFGAPQEPNRRSFSLANALQERVDQQNKEIAKLKQQLSITQSRLTSAEAYGDELAARIANIALMLEAANCYSPVLNLEENTARLLVMAGRWSAEEAQGWFTTPGDE